MDSLLLLDVYFFLMTFFMAFFKTGLLVQEKTWIFLVLGLKLVQVNSSLAINCFIVLLDEVHDFESMPERSGFIEQFGTVAKPAEHLFSC